MSIYQNIKGNITTRQAAERYGLRVARNGMTRCPFHDDHTPSMKVDKRYHCFGCQADGDVIDFTARLLNVGNYEAAQKLAIDFAISDKHPSASVQPSASPSPYTQQSKQRQDEALCFSVLTGYERLLTRWKDEYAPANNTAQMDDRFVEACQMLPYITYLADTLFVLQADERAIAVQALIEGHTIQDLQARMNKLTKEAQHDRNEISL